MKKTVDERLQRLFNEHHKDKEKLTKALHSFIKELVVDHEIEIERLNHRLFEAQKVQIRSLSKKITKMQNLIKTNYEYIAKIKKDISNIEAENRKLRVKTGESARTVFEDKFNKTSYKPIVKAIGELNKKGTTPGESLSFTLNSTGIANTSCWNLGLTGKPPYIRSSNDLDNI